MNLISVSSVAMFKMFRPMLGLPFHSPCVCGAIMGKHGYMTGACPSGDGAFVPAPESELKR